MQVLVGQSGDQSAAVKQDTLFTSFSFNFLHLSSLLELPFHGPGL